MICPQCKVEIVDDSQFCSKCGIPIHPSEDMLISHTRTILKPIEELLPGTKLDEKYKIIEVIGKGGMGIVYMAEDTQLKRKVALKFLPHELTMDEEAKERFILEAQTAAAHSHPNICTIHEINEEEGKSFIAMEYVEGQNLKDKIKEGPIPVDEVLDITIQVAHGLDEAHKKGIVHRDIKSANIMLTENGQAKVMDFGLAKVKGAKLLTREGTTLGTVAYMSPEQAHGEDVDRRTDLWSLGVVLYELLSNQLPFTGERESSILYSVVHEEPKPLKAIKPDISAEFQKIVNKALEKKPEDRYSSAAEMLKDLKEYQDTLRAEELGALNLKALIRRMRKPLIAIPAVSAILIIVFFTFWFFDRQAKIRWAREEILPEVERRVETSWRDFTDAYTLALEAEKYIPNDSELSELMSKCSLNISVKTEPLGANVYFKEYKTPESEWEYLGISPIENIRLPVGIFRWRIEKEGYETVFAASTTWDLDIVGKDLIIPYDFTRVLDKIEKVPPGMVRVQGAETPFGKLGDFYIDKYEVTNKQYKEFVVSGGYRNSEYWRHEFIKDRKALIWEKAMAEFVDQTDRPGPASWQAGDYPAGREDYPVSGISWYEAAAYAEFTGKSLPTEHHWGMARGEYTPLIMWPQLGGYAVFAPFSNFKSEGPAPAGSHQGMTSFGAYDMAGNVREWCWNETSEGRLIRGGAWDDNTYKFDTPSQAPPFDRSLKNGFRCVLYPDLEEVPKAVFQMAQFGEVKDFYKEEPVSDTVYEIYKEQFLYDETDLNARVESRDEDADNWIQEKITFDAAYGGERIIAHLFLPKNAASPYQTIIYFPGSASLFQNSSEDLTNYYEFPLFLSYVLKNGRAALFPVYKGTFERRDNTLALIHQGEDSHRFTEFMTQLGKDFKRCVDYLETREDIDSSKIAYCGMSWGAVLGSIIPAVEERLDASVLVAGGFIGDGLGRPEANQINYITRVKTPTLMLNGRYDTLLPFETSIKPMFDLLGTPVEHKELKLYETDHVPPMNDFIREALAWLDRYLGPVK